MMLFINWKVLRRQITSYVFDVVRAEVPKMKLDNVFERKDDVANAVKAELNDAMLDYGYDIIKTLVTDIDPDEKVKESMNRINASEREKVAAEYEAVKLKVYILLLRHVLKRKVNVYKDRVSQIKDVKLHVGLEESVDVLNNVGSIHKKLQL